MALDVSSAGLGDTGAPPKSCCQKRAAEAAPMIKPESGVLIVLRQYQPVLVIAGAALAGSLMLAASGGGHAMSAFMGLFLLPLALLKLFDVGGFAAAFARYDILARAWRPYGFVYPLLELALALFFLSGLFPVITSIAAVAVGGIGTIGIVQTLMRGEAVRCACVGSTLNVPLGAVSIAENAGMAIMAALMLAL